MQKAQRLNDMIQYLNDKNTFQLKDLMNHYQISKSTALRDIQSLEDLGMPLYSEPGRNGCYKILKNRLLAPILFTNDEMFALYFTMQTLQAYQNTPFHLDIEQLKKKFNCCLSPAHSRQLSMMEDILSFSAIQHRNSSPLLKEILQMALDHKVCQVTYDHQKELIFDRVQFFFISSTFGQWYVSAYNHQKNSIRVFRCDKILSIKALNDTPVSLTTFLSQNENIYRASSAIDFEVKITHKGTDLYYKENYPSMELIEGQETSTIRGFYNENEEEFIVNYLLGFREELLSIKPVNLKQKLVAKAALLHSYFATLN